mmetsp:Transcript_80826/g.195947  ORF Transcript_80826/g.195947 Transcript_80826/m.195947 type:complete len:348 (-) Transcript_80826:109-1152(-)
MTSQRRLECAQCLPRLNPILPDRRHPSGHARGRASLAVPSPGSISRHRLHEPGASELDQGCDTGKTQHGHNPKHAPRGGYLARLSCLIQHLEGVRITVRGDTCVRVRIVNLPPDALGPLSALLVVARRRVSLQHVRLRRQAHALGLHVKPSVERTESHRAERDVGSYRGEVGCHDLRHGRTTHDAVVQLSRVRLLIRTVRRHQQAVEREVHPLRLHVVSGQQILLHSKGKNRQTACCDRFLHVAAILARQPALRSGVEAPARNPGHDGVEEIRRKGEAHSTGVDQHGPMRRGRREDVDAAHLHLVRRKQVARRSVIRRSLAPHEAVGVFVGKPAEMHRAVPFWAVQI